MRYAPCRSLLRGRFSSLYESIPGGAGGKGEEKKVEETSDKNPWSGRVRRGSRTSNYLCCTQPLWEGRPRLYCTGWGMGPLGIPSPGGTRPRPVVGEGWEGLGASEPAQWRWRGRRMCVNKDRQTKGIRHTDRQADRQRGCVWGGGRTWALASDGANTFVAHRQSRRDVW